MTSDPQATVEDGGEGGEAAMDMGTLLEQSLDYKWLRRGEIVEGVVMTWERDGVLVDVGSKSEGLVLRHEMHSLGADPESQLGPGEKVLVFVMQPEAAEGQVLLSIDRARGEQGWRTLQERFDSQESFEADVTGYNKGGLLVNVEGVNAFVPLSQVVGVRPDRSRPDGGSLAEAMGRTLRLKVIEINRRRNRVILSERAALQEWRLEQKERLIGELKEGDIRRGRISSVRNFGVFVDLGGADGLAHLSELSWERDKTPSELFKVGDEVDVYVTKVDAENKKIALSLRLANPEKWDVIVDKYHDGQVVCAVVTKVVAFGAFARIEGPVEGLIHVSELVDRRIGHPKEVVQEGDFIPLKVVRIERDRHRLGLSLRRARLEGEQMGFVFSDGGEVISVPEQLLTDFEAREGPLPKPAPPAPQEAEAPQAATADAAVATEEPQTAATEPAVATEEAPADAEAETRQPAPADTAVATEEPPTAATEPAVATEEAPADAEAETTQPAPADTAVATEEPPSAATEPAVVTEEAPAEAEAETAQPAPADTAVATEEPPAEATEPAVATEEASVEAEAAEPAASTEEAPAEAEAETTQPQGAEAAVATEEPPAPEEPSEERPALPADEKSGSQAADDEEDPEPSP